MKKYIKMDIYRAVGSLDFYAGVVCVMLACWFCTYQMKEYDVYTMFTYICKKSFVYIDGSGGCLFFSGKLPDNWSRTFRYV